jgi:hypothetical protein
MQQSEEQYDMVHDRRVVLSISCFGSDFVLDLATPSSGDITWGYVAHQALLKWRTTLPPVLSDAQKDFLRQYIPAEGPFEVVMYEPKRRTVSRATDIVPRGIDTWSLTEPPKVYHVVIEGPLLQRFSDEQLRNIFLEYLVDKPKHLLPLLLTSRRFHRCFTDSSVSIVLQSRFPLLQWQGIGACIPDPSHAATPIVTEFMLWERFGAENHLHAAEVFRYVPVLNTTSIDSTLNATLTLPCADCGMHHIQHRD